jgi:cysteine desulfurase / selenocysteine lyase
MLPLNLALILNILSGSRSTVNMDVENTRRDFPTLEASTVYFDNACMSLKPMQVIKKINEYYMEYPSCHGRSTYKLATRLNDEINLARSTVQKFIGAKRAEEIIFTRNTTESINLIAHTFDLKTGDIVLTTDKEHNSNLLPWIYMKKQKGINLQVLKSSSGNTFDLDTFEKTLKEKIKNSQRVKLIAFGHTSNIDGVTIPAKQIIKIAHEHGIMVLLDGAQAAPHIEINVKDLDVDFYAFSGHKMLGPSGIGVLYGKYDLLKSMPQFMVGGETVYDSTYDDYKVEELPMKFEAGLQNYSGIVGLGEACKYLSKIGLANVKKQEVYLNKIVTEGLKEEINNQSVKLIGPKDPELRGGIFNFTLQDFDSHEAAMMLDKTYNISLRAGAHCCHAWYNSNQIKNSVRASMYFYNTKKEADIFIGAVKEILELRR